MGDQTLKSWKEEKRKRKKGAAWTFAPEASDHVLPFRKNVNLRNIKLLFTVDAVGFRVFMVAQKHVCICPAATRVKPYYLNFQSSAIDRSMKLNLKKEKKKKKCRARTAAWKKNRNHQCVSNWVPSVLHYVQSLLSYWNQTSFETGQGRGGVGILPLTVNLKKGQMHQFDWRAVKTGEGSCFQRTGLFYASVLLVLLRSAVFLAVITCPSQHPAAPSPNCQKSDVPRRPWRSGLYSGPRLLCADTFFFFEGQEGQ